MTAGFLMIGIPSLPKVVKTFPKAESVISLLRSWKRTGHSGTQSNYRHGHPPGYEPKLRKLYNQTDHRDLGTHDLGPIESAMSAEDRMLNAIIREVYT